MTREEREALALLHTLEATAVGRNIAHEMLFLHAAGKAATVAREFVAPEFAARSARKLLIAIEKGEILQKTNSAGDHLVGLLYCVTLWACLIPSLEAEIQALRKDLEPSTTEGQIDEQ